MEARDERGEILRNFKRSLDYFYVLNFFSVSCLYPPARFWIILKSIFWIKKTSFQKVILSLVEMVDMFRKIILIGVLATLFVTLVSSGNVDRKQSESISPLIVLRRYAVWVGGSILVMTIWNHLTFA